MAGCHRVRTSMRIALSASLALALFGAPAHAQAARSDLAGVWAADFITPLERPDDVPDLIVPPNKAAEVLAKVSEKPTGVYDPDADYFFPDKLLSVRGELR